MWADSHEEGCGGQVEWQLMVLICRGQILSILCIMNYRNINYAVPLCTSYDHMPTYSVIGQNGNVKHNKIIVPPPDVALTETDVHVYACVRDKNAVAG